MSDLLVVLLAVGYIAVAMLSLWILEARWRKPRGFDQQDVALVEAVAAVAWPVTLFAMVLRALSAALMAFVWSMFAPLTDVLKDFDETEGRREST